MKVLAVFLALLLAPGDPAFCQQSHTPTSDVVSTVGKQSPPAQDNNGTPSAPPPPNTLLDGTAVKLRLSENISSETSKTGDQIPFEVIDEVLVQGTVVIPKGAQALATVTDAQPKRRMGRGGKLDVNVDSVRLGDGEKAQLRAVKDGKGGGHVGAMTGAMVATAIVFFPAAPLFLFMHGKSVDIPKGTEVTAFVQGDMRLVMANFGAGGTAPTVAAAAPSATGAALTVNLNVESSVPGADIEVDGAFVGNTPSTVSIPAGQHTITVKKKGYANWSRTVKKKGYANWSRSMNVSGSSVHLSADLEAKP